MTRRVLLALLVGCAACAAWGDDAGRGQGAQDYLNAFRAGDEAAMAAIAKDPPSDPYRMVSALYASHVRGATADPPAPKDYLDAAGSLAARCRDQPGCERLPALVATWRALTVDVWRAERDLRDGAAKVDGLLGRDDVRGALNAAQALDPELAIARSSPHAVRVWSLRVQIARRMRDERGALEASRVAARLADEVGSIRIAAWSWGDVAGFLLGLGEFEAAAAAGTEALARFELLRDRRDAIDMRRLLAHALARTGRADEALAAIGKARAEAEQVGDPKLVTAARLTEGTVLFRLGRVDEAIALDERIAREAREAGDRELEADVLTNLGASYVEADRLAEGLAAYERALEARGDGGGRGRSILLTNLGILYRRLRRTDLALQTQRRALEAAREQGTHEDSLTAMENLAVALHQDGHDDEAVRLAEETLAERRRGGDRSALVRAQGNLASYLRSLDRGAEASALLRDALAGARALGDPRVTAWVLRALGEDLYVHGDVEGAAAAQAESIELYLALGDRSPGLAIVCTNASETALQRKRYAEAIDLARRSLALQRDLVRGLGEEDALLLREKTRGAVEVGVEAAAALAAQEPARAEEAAAMAFDLAESGRGLLLAEGLVNADALLAASLPPDLRRDDATTLARVDAARRGLQAAGRRGDAAAVTAARATLASAWEERTRTVSRVQRESRRTAEAVYPRPVDLAGLRERLDAGTALVVYVLTAENAEAVVVTHSGAALRGLGPSRPIADLARGFARLVSTPGGPEDIAARKLYELLVRPLEADLGERTRLVVVPDVGVAFLPFAALLRDGPGRPQRLVERAELAMAPSATVYDLLAGDAAAAKGVGVVAVGDPAYPPEAGLDPLPGSGREAQEVAARWPADHRTLLLGEAAGRDALVAALTTAPGRLATIHLACHAFVDDEEPRLSGLVLARGETLDVDRIHRLRVRADLAVLSACETARGRAAGSEGVLGFVRGFLLAGVPRVVASAWRVPDERTRAFMRSFYDGTTKEGLAPAAALRAAQVERLRAGGPGAHPSAWAAFALWGRAD